MCWIIYSWSINIELDNPQDFHFQFWTEISIQEQSSFHCQKDPDSTMWLCTNNVYLLLIEKHVKESMNMNLHKFIKLFLTVGYPGWN